MKCPFFKEIRMLIDYPKVIRELCRICKIHPTHPGAQTLIEDLKDDLDKYSLEVHRIYDKVWEERNKLK